MGYGDGVTVRRLLRYPTWAVVGLSANPQRPSYGVARFLQAHRVRVIPVNPNCGASVLGERAYCALADIPDPVDVVDVFRRSAPAACGSSSTWSTTPPTTGCGPLASAWSWTAVRRSSGRRTVLADRREGDGPRGRVVGRALREALSQVGILGSGGVGERALEVRHLLPQPGIGGAEDAHSEQPGVAGAGDGDGGHRHAGARNAGLLAV